MNSAWLGSRSIRINWANQKTPMTKTTTRNVDLETVLKQTPHHTTTVYIGNISPETTERQIKEVFEDFGGIEEIRVNAPKGYAFVKFHDHRSAGEAILNGSGKIIDMRTIRCSWGKEKGDSDSGARSSPVPLMYPPTSVMPMVPMGMIPPNLQAMPYPAYPMPYASNYPAYPGQYNMAPYPGQYPQGQYMVSQGYDQSSQYNMGPYQGPAQHEDGDGARK